CAGQLGLSELGVLWFPPIIRARAHEWEKKTRPVAMMFIHWVEFPPSEISPPEFDSRSVPINVLSALASSILTPMPRLPSAVPLKKVMLAACDSHIPDTVDPSAAGSITVP